MCKRYAIKKGDSMKKYSIKQNKQLSSRKVENVTLEITQKCNFNCKHCCNDSGQKSNDQLSKEEISKLLENLISLNVKRVGFTGGEPFCDENLFKYLEVVKDRIPEITISSNGYLIDADIIKKLKEYNVKNISISLDGTKTFHDNFRNKIGAYDNAIEAIKLLKKENINVKVRSVITKNNRNEILNLIEIMNELKIKRHDILPVCPIGRADKDLVLTKYEYKDFLIQVIEKIKNLEKVNITFKIQPVFGQEQLFQNIEENIKRKSLDYKCDALKDSIEITSSGDVIPCSFVRETIGNIREQNISEIFNSDLALDFLEKIHNSYKLGPCKNCASLEKCSGGCYAHRLYGDGVNKKDMYCFVEEEKYV